MKFKTPLTVITSLIILFALLSAGLGLFSPTNGQPFSYTNHRGETVTINNRGLYRFDTVNTAAQEQGNDLITLVVGIPLLGISLWLARRGSLRGRLLLTGTLGFFLYTYMSMSMLTSFNSLFLVYVALFGLSLYAFILSMLTYDLNGFERNFSTRLPRGWIAADLFIVSAFLTLAWLGRILPGLMGGQPPTLENTTTLVIQAMDLVLIVPLALLGGILLLKRNPWGYLLSTVFVLKAITMGLGVSAMGINQSLAGSPDSMAVVIPFLVITLINLVMAVLLLKSITPASQTV